MILKLNNAITKKIRKIRQAWWKPSRAIRICLEAIYIKIFNVKSIFRRELIIYSMDKLIILIMIIHRNFLYLIDSFIMRAQIDMLITIYHPPPTLCLITLRYFLLPKETSAQILKGSLIIKLGGKWMCLHKPFPH